jgi:AGZA family xanthine/uracil permease-like MFS transporter
MKTKAIPTCTWAHWGDINAFFGLILDNATVMIVLVALVTSVNPAADQRFSREFVLTQMIPGTALGVLIGDLVYTWMAIRLARRTGRSDVTAMPLGLDTPSTFAVGTLVLLPALNDGIHRFGLEHSQAMVFSWHVGALVLLMIGIAKSVLAPFGDKIRRWVPRAGLLGSLAGIAIALIAFMPLWGHVAAVPVVGMFSLTIILVALVAKHALPGKIPGALAAVVLGAMLYFFGDHAGHWLGVPLVPESASQNSDVWRLPHLLPDFARNMFWWQNVLWEALSALPVMLPFAVMTVVGGIDCTESAVAAGDTYDTRAILLTEGVASMAAGIFGGVIQNTPYIGHPAYKAAGGRSGYTLATALFIGAAGLFGWFLHLFAWLPEPAAFPILVFVGLEITAQSFHATPQRHYPAVALAILPTLAYLVLIPLEQAIMGNPPPHLAVAVQSLRCLSNGFVVTSLLWASALASMLDNRLLRSAGCMMIAAVCALFGIIHSPLAPAMIALPNKVWNQMPTDAAIRCQSPYHWAAAYVLAALVLVVLYSLHTPTKNEGVANV